MNIQERLAVFYSRLRQDSPAKTANEALVIISQTLEEVEAEFCPVVAANPAPKSFDGRMYLPQSDNIDRADDGSVWIKTRHHRISISPDGSFAIFREMPKKVLLTEFRKEGARS